MTTTATPEEVRRGLGRARRWVVKVGSALATNDGVGLNLPAIESWARTFLDILGCAP